LKEIKEFLDNQSTTELDASVTTVKTWNKAIEVGKDSNLVVISIPGIYAYEEANRALDENKHVFIFSDNISKNDELMLKQKAHSKGLLVMGPDCGTGIISGVPIAFTNNISTGKIGIVGASGTGIQEVTTIIDKLGSGVSHAIGTGGRDLSEEIGGITMIDSILALDKDDNTEVIVVISKPPAKKIKEKVISVIRSLKKPVCAIFIGEKPTHHEENIYYAYTLEEAANIAVNLVNGIDIEMVDENKENYKVANINLSVEQKYIKGFYSGGTLASEAAMLISDALNLSSDISKKDGYILKSDGHEIIDLGDDVYTQGKPHPMIDPEKRIEFIKQALSDKNTAVILLDIVLGHGSHLDMASKLAPSIIEVISKSKESNAPITFIATVCGTYKDKQDYSEQVRILKEAGVIVANSNNKAVRMALSCIGNFVEDIEKKIKPKVIENSPEEKSFVSQHIAQLLNKKPYVLNIGLKSFTNSVEEAGAKAIQFDWKPLAGGNKELQKVLSFLYEYNY
jgi:FdrA protein